MAFELELPAVYLDAVLLDPTPARPAVTNRDPEPGETQVPVGTPVGLDITDVGPDGIDTAATEVYVAGLLAFSGGVFRPGFDGPAMSKLGRPTVSCTAPKHPPVALTLPWRLVHSAPAVFVMSRRDLHLRPRHCTPRRSPRERRRRSDRSSADHNRASGPS